MNARRPMTMRDLILECELIIGPAASLFFRVPRPRWPTTRRVSRPIFRPHFTHFRLRAVANFLFDKQQQTAVPSDATYTTTPYPLVSPGVPAPNSHSSPRAALPNSAPPIARGWFSSIRNYSSHDTYRIVWS